MKELLITGAWRCGEQQVQALEQIGYAVTFWPDERQAVNMDTQRFEAVICGGLFLTTPIERFPALKCIQVTSAGLDRVPLDYCKAHGITVYMVFADLWVQILSAWQFHTAKESRQ